MGIERKETDTVSTAINTYEILEIHNVNAATMDMAEKLVEYMQQFNRMAGLESLSNHE